MYDLSWLNPTPHAIAVYASRLLSPVATQHSLPSGRYSLLGPDFHRLDRTSFAAGALTRSPRRHGQASTYRHRVGCELRMPSSENSKANRIKVAKGPKNLFDGSRKKNEETAKI